MGQDSEIKQVQTVVFHVRVNHIPVVKVGPILFQIFTHFSNTKYAAPGLLSFFLATLPLKLCPVVPSQSQSYTNGRCTGPLLVLSSRLSTSQSGSLAGIFHFLAYQQASDSPQKGPILLGSKNFVLVILILATDTGESSQKFL